MSNSEQHHPDTNSRSSWTMVPTVLVRHAGYPFSDLSGLDSKHLAKAAEEVLNSWHLARAAAHNLKRLLRDHAVSTRGNIGTTIGMLGHLSPSKVRIITKLIPIEELEHLATYRQRISELDKLGEAFQRAHHEAMESAQLWVTNLFDNPSRQQVLLMSNDAVFTRVQNWRRAPSPSREQSRKMTDLLTMYLQRITTKNETNAHFGPFAIGRVDTNHRGLRWEVQQQPERFPFLAHWAASAVFRTADWHGSRDRLRPRLNPLVFWSDRHVTRFEFSNAPDLPFPWHLTKAIDRPLNTSDAWLLKEIDGECTVADLRERWHTRFAASDFESTLQQLIDQGLATGEPELPTGNADTLSMLRDHLADMGLNCASVDHLEKLLGEFQGADASQRVDLMNQTKKYFELSTGQSGSRGAGRHYADRSVLFEECFSPAHSFTVGAEVHRFITEELAVTYDALLMGPRIRMIKERDILHNWLTQSFGAEFAVPLGVLYDRFLKNRDQLARQCDRVDDQIAKAERDLADTLLAGWDGVSPEVRVPAEVARELIAHAPTQPAAVCNPDVMLAASSVQDFATGDFFGVVGDCHAVRDLLTHGCFVPLLQMRCPEVVDQVVAGYRRLLDKDEVLVDVVRDHTSKVSAQADLGLLHLEAAGRSAKPRRDVLRPQDLVVAGHAGQLALRCPGVAGRIRLATSLSGAASIRHDPLAVFGFPRSLGGGVLSGLTQPYLPRLRIGRVVLTRQRWRITCGDIQSGLPGRKWHTPDVRNFLSVTRIRNSYRLPRHVFVKFSHEPKPIFVDWTAPLLVRQFHRLNHQASADHVVEISEMLPSPEQLWLDISGQRFTAELRCAVFSTRTGS